jgi:autotransporter passenger strand-loop-strand repeat protein
VQAVGMAVGEDPNIALNFTPSLVGQIDEWEGQAAAYDGLTLQNGEVIDGWGVGAGRYLDVLAGATVQQATVDNGGTENVFGLDAGGTVNDGGLQIVFAGGIAQDTILNDPGMQIVSSGGTTVAPLISGGIEELAAGAIVSGAITFAGIGGVLRIDDPSSGGMPAAVISGLRPGDTIDLTSVGFDIGGTIALASSNVLQVVENGHTYDLKLDPSQSFAGWDLKLSSDGATGTDIRLGGQTDDFGFGRTSDILFRDDSSGDTWFEAMSNGVFADWTQIGGSNTSYAAVGVGDFFGTGTSDALFRNNSTGDIWVETISSGAFAGWSQIGGSDTHYSVVGVGDFYGSGTDDILFRNNSTGDSWFEAISNGAAAGWKEVGGSDTTYAVVAVGDYFGNGTDDILFRNNATGDTWIEAISNGASAGWHQVGGSNSSYSVKT